MLAVGAVVGLVIWAMDPGLLLANTTVAGGDTGAHVALAQFLKTNLLPHFRVTGWDPGAYDGFPLNTFYFPLPDALAAVGGYIIPFNVAFKLMTILGSLTLPVAAWAFGRLAGLERPRPALLAVATLPFLFDQSYTIYGGDLFSTLAGEYAYSLGLSLALVFLGLAIRGMRTGRMRVPAALLLAACILCHVVTALFALVGALVVLLVCVPTMKRIWWMVSTVGVGLLLASFWLVPFITEQAYSTNMGWLNVTTFASLLAPGGSRWALAIAAIGAVILVLRRDRVGILFLCLGTASALALAFDPQGKLYNTRFLPLWWVCVYLIAGLGVAELGVLGARLVRELRARWWVGARVASLAPALLAATSFDTPSLSSAGTSDETSTKRTGKRFSLERTRQRHSSAAWSPGAVAVPLLALAGALAVVVPDLAVAPGAPTNWGPLHIAHSNVTDWAQWNYSGYERKPGWTELHDGIVPALDRVARRYGCGRVMWEYSVNLNRFGTPESLMNLPMWTGGCLDSMEGLLFESSGTTPYHFLNQAELSTGPSEAMVNLPYGPLDVALGVAHLQLLGVRYFMASSRTVQAQADADPALTPVASTGPWHTQNQGTTVTTTWKIYLVHDAPIVSPLALSPEVLEGTADGQSSWLPVAERWYSNPALWAQQLTQGGPSSWRRVNQVYVDAAVGGRKLPQVKVSDIRMTDDEVSFHVDRTGVPVLVRVSYFPAWHASGASGPWRAEPNLMVVVPTSHTVSLEYGSTSGGLAGQLMSIVGLVLLVLLFVRRDVLLTT